MFVKPTRPGLVLFDPVTGRQLPDEGMRVAPQQFWYRRMRDGDVIEAEPPAPAPKEKPKRKAKAKGDE